MTILRIVLHSLAGLVVIATVLPMWRTSRWWVRLCDFPRFQIAVLAAALIVLIPMSHWPPTRLQFAALSLVILSFLWQLWWVWRYLPIAPFEVQRSNAPPSASDCISLLTTNVFQNGRDCDALLQIICDTNPDLALAVESDEWWCSKLRDGLQTRYPHFVCYPLSNGYGMALFSRRELVEPSIRFLVDDAIPSIKVGVRLRSGAVIDLYGLHPQPPAPRQDSSERDAELILVGIEIQRAGRPAIVLGDLNDVAWSPMTSEFKRIGNLLDPRRGRGFFNTYPAGLPGFRYPLDYVFHTKHFTLEHMRVLPRFKSDHLPLTVQLCLAHS
jgi:endonuclease/exonuclease/phosphatase (EEP) superfamily protein YafD